MDVHSETMVQDIFLKGHVSLHDLRCPFFLLFELLVLFKVS